MMKRVLVTALLLLAACDRAAPEPEVHAADLGADAGAPLIDDNAAAAPVEDGAEAAPPPDEPQSLVVLRFDCRGQQADWRLRLTADGHGRLREDGGTRELAGELKQTAGGHAWRAAALDAPGESFAALLTPAACFPPEGGNAREFTLALGWPDGRRADGCCSAVRGLDVYHAPDLPAAADDDDWSARIPAQLASLERCALDAGVDARAAVFLDERADGRVVVRLRDSDGRRFDCLLDPAGGDIEAVAAVADDRRAAGEGRSEWLPAGTGRAPALDCGAVFVTRDAAGDVRGWLHRRDGCGR